MSAAGASAAGRIQERRLRVIGKPPVGSGKTRPDDHSIHLFRTPRAGCYLMISCTIRRSIVEVLQVAVPSRSEIAPGMRVLIVEKQNQRSGVTTEGIVARILTKSPTHPHGIKVMLEDGRVGRVKAAVLGT